MNIFNRISYKLKAVRLRNPADQIVRAEKAFEPIVDLSLFQRAQSIIAERNKHFSDDEMLDRLRELLATTGSLSALIIDEQNNMPASGAYRSRFGSLLKAYQLVGYIPARDFRYIETNQFLRSL
jgi:hypothetical protein